MSTAERLLRPKEACQRLGISYPTLARWVREGRIRAVRTAGGKYRIPESEVMRIAEGLPVSREVRAVIYARVSSPGQKGDLEGQIQYLRQYCSSKGYKVIDVLSDVASGLKAGRKGLMRLLEYVTNRQVDVVVVTYKDRLARFGLEYLEFFLRQYGVRVEAALGDEPRDSRQELVEDMVEVVSSLAGRLYGVRSRRRRELVEGFKKLLKEVGEGE
ncbi:MAG: IS607 family transposase [Acidilobus sp.]